MCDKEISVMTEEFLTGQITKEEYQKILSNKGAGFSFMDALMKTSRLHIFSDSKSNDKDIKKE
jgi:hypothetical protein